MDLLCGLFDKTKQAYYGHGDFSQRKMAEEAFVLEFVKSIRKEDPGLGGEKLWKIYRKRFGPNFEYRVGRDKMERIISKYGLTVRKPRRKPKTTDSRHGLHTFANLVKDIIPLEPNRIWVSDITYIPIWIDMKEGIYHFCYLCLVTDAYSKEIIGWSVGKSLEAIYALEALKMAMTHLDGEEAVDLIHHSDRGVQYASYTYVNLLHKAGIRISMTESGDPKDNAIAERVNGIIKNELLKDIAFRSIEEVNIAVAKAVDFYNNERPHMSLDWLTPSEASRMNGTIKKRWCSFREQHLNNLQVKVRATNFAG